MSHSLSRRARQAHEHHYSSRSTAVSGRDQARDPVGIRSWPYFDQERCDPADVQHAP